MPPWQYGCVTAWGQAAVLFVSRRALPDTRMRRRRSAATESVTAGLRLGRLAGHLKRLGPVKEMCARRACAS